MKSNIARAAGIEHPNALVFCNTAFVMPSLCCSDFNQADSASLLSYYFQMLLLIPVDVVISASESEIEHHSSSTRGNSFSKSKWTTKCIQFKCQLTHWADDNFLSLLIQSGSNFTSKLNDKNCKRIKGQEIILNDKTL